MTPGATTTRWHATLLAALYLAGVAHWVLFLDYGRFPRNFADWQLQETYHGVLRDALLSGQVPWHVSSPVSQTDRFLAIPETPLTPQIILLRWMDLGHYILANTLLMFTVGFIGCLAIRREYSLEPLAFAVLFLLFNWNGHITDHLGVAHTGWYAYFLLPWFFLAVLRWVRDEPRNPASAAGRRTILLGIAITLLAMFAQGGFHIFLWCLLLLLLVALFHRELRREFIVIAAAAAALCAYRLIPAMLTYGQKGYAFIGGFPTVRDLWDALTAIQTADRFTPGWWDDLFVGIVGLTALAYFGVRLRFSEQPELAAVRFQKLDGALLVMAAFSMHLVYWPVAALPLPFANAERITSRFLIIPLVALMIIGSIRFSLAQEPLLRTGLRRAVTVALVLQMAADLLRHSYHWRVTQLAVLMGPHPGPGAVQIVPRSDPVYTAGVVAGAAISAVAVAVVAAFFRRRQPRAASAGS